MKRSVEYGASSETNVSFQIFVAAKPFVPAPYAVAQLMPDFIEVSPDQLFSFDVWYQKFVPSFMLPLSGAGSAPLLPAPPAPPLPAAGSVLPPVPPAPPVPPVPPLLAAATSKNTLGPSCHAPALSWYVV